MGKGTPKIKTQEDIPQEDRPDPPPKKLSVQEVRELNLATEEDVPDVPAQNLTEEDFRNLNLVSVHACQRQCSQFVTNYAYSYNIIIIAYTKSII